MDLGLKGKVAVVAGGSAGLGFAAALELAREGANIVLNARRETELKTAAWEIRSQTAADVLPFAADVSNEGEVGQIIQSAISAFGRLDILVANAGGPPAGFFDDFTASDFRAAIDLNLASTIEMCRSAVPHMRKQGWGRIVGITSVSAKQPIENLILSNTSRAATVAFLKTLSQQVGAHGITVNALCPGYHLTERLRSLMALQAKEKGLAVEDLYQQLASSIPLRRIGEPSEFAAVVAFLCSERASYVSGAVLQVDGGWYKGLL